MAQLVARLVRNEKVGGSNPPSSTTGRHPIADVGFLYAWRGVAVPGCCVACGAAGVSGAARAVLWAGLLGVLVGGGLPALCCLRPHGCSGRRRARPPARSPHASLKARSGRSRSPPVPSGPSGALHTGGTWCADGVAHRLHAGPGTPVPQEVASSLVVGVVQHEELAVGVSHR